MYLYQLTFYEKKKEKNGALLTHWCAILGQSKLLDNFFCWGNRSFHSRLWNNIDRVPPLFTFVYRAYLCISLYVVHIFVYFCSPYLDTTTRGRKVNTKASLVYPPSRPLSLGPWHSLCELFCPFLFRDSTWLCAFYSVRISCKAGQCFNKHHLHVGERKLISSRTCRIQTSAI